MRAIVLGSAAGGGVPQWNCACLNCRLARSGEAGVVPRSQSGFAVSVDGEAWALVNASPDLRQQIVAQPALWPRHEPRHSPIAAVILTSQEIDHVAGLLTLRERQPFTLWATAGTLAALAANPIFGALAPDRVERRAVSPDERFAPVEGLEATFFAAPGKAALWREGEGSAIGAETEATVGLLLAASGRRLAIVPGCAAVSEPVRERLRGVDALLFDGTVFHDDDLARAGVGAKSGRRMGHVAMAGPDGSLARLAGLGIGRRVYVHLNNTNPALREGSPERALVEEAGWTVAHDGLMVEP